MFANYGEDTDDDFVVVRAILHRVVVLGEATAVVVLLGCSVTHYSTIGT